MPAPILYRKRIIPAECVLLKDDKVLYQDDRIIVTGWHSLKPKKDLHHGYSCYYLQEGYKVSKFYREDNSLLYWYCDIVEYDYEEAANTYIVTDLLADVIIYPDGFVKVVDIDELVTALNENLISENTLKKSLLCLSSLLEIIYSGRFKTLQTPIEQVVSSA
ncbi:MAG: DUF402 domain-containing protein [Roseburia sp.]|nr:DUF402 domain-containing protein [Ruminococcus sp.]MCM1156644.1 DUF402 domain-containing protein [Roseburia sp.]MCM1242477.1 DUF402 domain-containing protein [Roseburia sp.]